MSNITKNLKQATGYDWQEINDVYLKFRLKHSKKMGQMCVFTPDDLKKARARLFLPEQTHGLDVHKPDVFLKKYLNARQQVVKNMPWVKFDLDQFPSLNSVQIGQIANKTVVIQYSLNLTGDIKLRKTNSQNQQTISLGLLKNLSYNAKEIVGKYILTNKVNFDLTSGQVTVGASVHDELGTTSIKLNRNEIEAEYTPSGNVKHARLLGWEIEGQIGYKIKATYEVLDDGSAFPSEIAQNYDKQLMLDIAGIAIVALIIFTDGLAMPFVSGVAGSILT